MVLLNEEKVYPNQLMGSEDENMWYLENGASNHMTGSKALFAELDEKVTSQMTEEGYDIGMKREFLRMYDEAGHLIMKVQRSRNRLYKIKLTPGKPTCLAVSMVDDSWLWHARMGHTSFRMLEEMTRKQTVSGMPLVSHPAQVEKESDSGIRCQLMTPHTPQQNGVVERRNRTILEMTRSLLKAMTVPDQFWGEAVSHSVYLLNRTGTKALKDVTPYEAWKGSKPSVAHLNVFGCVGFVKKLRGLSKLSDRSEAMVYLGVEEGTKGYQLYNPRNHRIVIARDVVFEESRTWSWTEDTINEPLTTPY
uniref:Integrase catalytic domain-containing protein n=1 Tax=Lactuca sativa TaxID=4236 RepID=A0A9R1UW61_LACSA|nr:hypothetical protein LSAT_V11C700382440 [Lactuca sativa]